MFKRNFQAACSNCVSIATNTGFNQQPIRCFRLASVLQHKNQMPREWKLHRLNKGLRLVRNDVSGKKVPFKRAGVWYNLHPPKKKPDPLTEYIRNVRKTSLFLTGKTENNVYFLGKHNSAKFSIKDSLKELQRVTELDFTPSHTPVTLHIRIAQMLAGKAKKKRPMTFSFFHPLPIPTGYQNTVGVFTSDDTMAEKCLKKGAAHAGGRELVLNVCKGVVDCDLYMCQNSYANELKNQKEVVNKLGSKYPMKGHILDDPSEVVGSLTNHALYTNVPDTKQVDIVIGKLNMSDDKLHQNIEAAYEGLFIMRKLRHARASLVSDVSISADSEKISLKLEEFEEDIEEAKEKQKGKR